MAFSSSTSRRVNQNVSTSAVTRAEKAQINELVVVSEFKAHRANRSLVWQYYGSLSLSLNTNNTSTSGQIIDGERIYCR
jgi:hypothetical protein